MSFFFRDQDAEIANIERWSERRRQVQHTADSVTPEQLVNMRRLAQLFPTVSPGVVRGLGQAGFGPDDAPTQFAILQELMRNHSQTGTWSGQVGTQVRQPKHPTYTNPAPKDSDEARAFNSPANPVNKQAEMERAQQLIKEGETLGVFNPTTQFLVEPEFGTGDDPDTESKAHKVFARLQDTIYAISNSPVPYLARDGKVRGFTPLSGSTGDREYDMATGVNSLDEFRPDPTILGNYRNESGVGGSIGYKEDFGAGAQASSAQSVIAQIFADSENNANIRRTAQAGVTQSAQDVSAAGFSDPGSINPLVRGAFMAFDAPLQEGTGLVRNIYGQFHGEDVDWLESQSDLGITLGQLAGGESVDLGTGFFVDPESAVARERRSREAERGQIGNHNLTVGRILANGVGLTPDSKPFAIVSGLTDMASAIALDPTAYGLGKAGGIQQSRKMFTATDDLATAGAFKGLRNVFHGPTFEAWANDNTKLIDRLAEIRSPYEIRKLTNGKLEPNLVARLAWNKKPENVRGILADAIDRGSILTTTELSGTRTQRFMHGWQKVSPVHTARTARILKMMPGQTLDLDNQAQVAENLLRVLDNAHASEETKEAIYNMAARATSRNGLRGAAIEAQGRVGGLLDQYGIHDPEVRSWLTRINVETYNEDLRGLIDETGADVPTWDSIAHDGKPLKVTSAHLPLEHISQYMHLPDQRAVRRLTTKFNFLTATGTEVPILRRLKFDNVGKEVYQASKVGDLRLPLAAADFIMSDILKPAWLLRIAWPIRVIGEEQLRIASSGLDSATKHPISYLATVIGSKLGTSPSGDFFEGTAELTAVTYRAHAGWLGEPGVVRSNMPTIYSKNNVHETADWRSSWAHELALLHNDPVGNYVANHDLEDAVQWLANGAGKKYRNELVEAHPGNLGTIQQVRDYVDTVVARISRATSNHPDLIDVVKSGKWSTFKDDKETVSQIFHDRSKINPSFTNHLRGYEDIGPDKIKGRASIALRNDADFPNRAGLAVDRFMSLLMGQPTSKLSRSPAFRQFVWRRASELLPHADDDARTAILAAAKKAKLNSRQMRSLERAAGRGKKELVEAPLAKGKVRLYRGEGPIYDDVPKVYGERTGRFYTTNRSYASQYGELHYIDVAPDHPLVAAVSKEPDARPEIVIPTEMMSQKQPLTSSKFAGKLNADDIDTLAKAYAIDDTKQLLYDLSERSQITDIMRILVPFGEAWKEVITRWAKLATISGPGGVPLPGKPVRRFQQTIQAARGEGLGQFAGTGLDPETGKQRGFFYKNEFGEEVYTYPGSEWLTSGLTGVPVPLTGRVQGLNMFGTIIPGLGPAAQIPIAWFLQDKPELDWWREQLLPFGAPGSEESQDVVSLREYMPGWLKTGFDVMFEGGYDDRMFNSSIMYTATYLYSTGEYGDSVEEQQRLLEDAKDAGKKLFGIRAFGQMILPSSPTFEWVTKVKDGSLINTRILAEEFYSLQEEDYDTAIEKFLDIYGPNAVSAIIPHSRNVISAVPTSLEAAQWVSKNESVRKQFSLVYGFFAPQGGEFHMPTYAQNYMTGERDPITPVQWRNMQDTLLGNYHYNRAKDMLQLGPGKAPNEEQRAWLSKQRANVLEAYPNWDNNVGLAQRPDNEQMVRQLYLAVKDRKVLSTDAGKGLAAYLAFRDKAVVSGHNAGFVGYAPFASANDMASTRQWLADHAYQIMEEHPDFERLWDVVFSREMEDPIVEPDRTK